MEQRANRLIREKSPYLQQHAHNPVDWYPWGEEALSRAREEDKPVFLSVGYSTCHWCHVMAHESFDNPHIAEILNRWFISVKVDREERPDIDQLYMAATQAMTGGGGWPMSVFLFPDGRAFYAGTYFPPESRYGRPGFGDLLTAIHDAWKTRRDDLRNVAARLFQELAQKGRGAGKGAIADTVADNLYLELKKGFDPVDGGFHQAPKFPRPVLFNFLLQHWQASGQEPALEMVLVTLHHIIRGGIHDHIGGGFHRYATDRAWRVPHFEKMLYDQALLVSSCTDAFLVTGDLLYAAAVDDICTYVLRDLTDPGGGFYSAEDADSEDPYRPGSHSEGAFYLWTEKEIFSVLPADDARIFCFSYGVEAGGNAPEDPHGEFRGKNILYRRRDVEEAAKQFRLSKSEVRHILNGSRLVLFEARCRRKRPHLDDKVLVSWNGLMIGALARAGVVFRQQRWIDAAGKSARFIEAELYNNEALVLSRRYRLGERGLAGQLDDYAFLASGLLALYQATQNPDWLQWAVTLTQTQIRLFWDSSGGGFFDGAEDVTLPCRMKGDYDGAEPAGNSMAALNLLHLSDLTSNDEWRRLALTTMEAFSDALNQQPEALPQMLCAWRQAGRRPRWIIVAGPPGREDTAKMLSAAFSTFEPGRIVLHADSGSNQQFLARYLPFMADLEMVDGLATAYVCENFTCRLPVNTPAGLDASLQTPKSDRML